MIKSKLILAWLIAVSIVFFTVAVLSPARAVEPNSYTVRYTAEFTKESLSFDKLKGYDIVGLRDGDWFSDVGKPMLPSKEFKIALPTGMAVKSVQVVNTNREEILGEYNIFPSQPPLKVGFSDKDVVFVEPDKQTYTSTQPYPSKLVEFVRQTDLAGQSMAVIQVYPLQYDPAGKKLALYTSITVEIVGVGGYECGDYLSPKISENNRMTYEQMVKSMVNNPKEVQLNSVLKMSTSMVPPGGPFAHVIITSSTYASYFQPLVDWHNQKGVKDTVITTDWIYTNYAETGDTTKIRAFIVDAYNTWGTTYFLIGGENETVPFCYRSYYESTPSDQYYSDFDDDWTHEVFVGRVSVGSTTEVNTFVGKVLKYEKDPPRTDYPLDVLLIGMDLDASTLTEQLKENIKSYIPSQFNVTKVYDSQTTNHRTATINALNAGQNLVNHSDHSNITVLGTGDFHHGWGIYNADVDALTNNNQLSIIVSTGCDPNYMDDNDDCIAEHFVLYNPNQAGVAFTGNTRVGLYYSGQPMSLSSALDRLWWIELFYYKKYNLGQTLANAKNNFYESNNNDRHCEWTFNLLGEPEMPIWTDAPSSFVVTCAATVPMGTSSLSIHVKDATTLAPIDQAYVCLWKAGEVYLTGYSNASGNVTFNPSPSSNGFMYVTTTKQNYIPYQKLVDVSYACGDITKDGRPDLGDLIYLISYLYKGGPGPDPLELGDVNLDSQVNLSDIVYLINYLYKSGPAPCQP